MQGMIQFDLTALNSLITNVNQISHATLNMRTQTKLRGGNIIVDVKRIKKPWIQGAGTGREATVGEVEWDHSKFGDSTTVVWWEKHGMYGDSDRNLNKEDSAWITASETLYTWDVFSAVRNAYQTGTNCKLLLQRRWMQTSGIWEFYSSEDPDDTKRPYLVVGII
jgi:hypothetical protein